MGSTICRIVQESLSNGVRHADATLITVSIDRQGKEVRVEILDNGRGMSESNNPGFGLAGISERVRAIGGRLTVSNKPNGGVEVAAVLPFHLRQEAAAVSVQAEEP
jgi:two-component system sensor histidine kinase DesK